MTALGQSRLFALQKNSEHFRRWATVSLSRTSKLKGDILPHIAAGMMPLRDWALAGLPRFVPWEKVK
jgi:hypothetical protein